MTLQTQLQKLKDNWLIIVLIILVFSLGNFGSLFRFSSFGSGNQLAAYDTAESAAYSSRSYYGDDFAPEVEERSITKTANMQTDINRGEFTQAETTLHSIIDSSNSILLSQQVRTIGEGWRSYKTASYSIKVDATKYDAVITQLQTIGEVTSFNDNMQDITGIITNLQLEIEAEKSRLARYNALYDQTTSSEYKIDLADKIFDLERRIKYLEDRLQNQDQRVDYSTVYVSMQEERSGYASIELVKFSRLITNLVNSTNALLTFLFSILPWALAGLIFYVGYKKLRA